jgi:predicted outer membrane protein
MLKTLAVLIPLGFATFAVADDKLNDPQIATVALTAHSIDAERADIALKKGKSDLKEGAAKTAKQLGKLSGVAFDKAYVDAEVAYHNAVIDAINKVLIPQAKNAEVKQALENTIPTLQGHLVHAQQVQTHVQSEK